MLRTNALRAAALIAVFVPPAVHADPYDDLLKAQAAFQNLKSWHADELMPNGKTVTVDFAAPDRWRIHPTPQVEELLIGNDAYMVRNGQATKLPFGGGMLQKMIRTSSFSVQQEVKNTAQVWGRKPSTA